MLFFGDTKMKDTDIEKLIDKNTSLLLLIGYATALVIDYKNNPSRVETNKNDEKIKWFLESVENVIYFDKPLAKMP